MTEHEGEISTGVDMNRYDVSRILPDPRPEQWFRYPSFVIWYDRKTDRFSWADTHMRRGGFYSHASAVKDAAEYTRE